MEINNLGQDRFLRKDSKQDDQTKGAAYAALNPAPKRGDDSFRKIGRPKGSEEDDGAPNILTGTVITSCFIQTSALPSRIEMQGNDLTFFDDTYEKDGEVVGDTSRIIFTHDFNSEEGFVMEKRASVRDTYDNVFSFYALPPKQGRMNYMFYGMEGTGLSRETNVIQFIVKHKSSPVTKEEDNGKFIISGDYDGGPSNPVPNLAIQYNSLFGIPGDGYTIYLAGTGTGFILVNSSVLPFTSDIDLGTIDNRFRKIYVEDLDISGEIIGGVPSQIVTITSSQTWTVPDGVTKVLVEGVGGGGGGAGSNGGLSVSGGGAGYCRKIIDLTGIPSVSITVGTGGAGGASGSNPGADGNDTTFGSEFTAGKGKANGTGGTATGGDLNIPGNLAGPSIPLYGSGSTTNRNVMSGMGGGTFFGPGAASVLGEIASQAPGNAAIIYGGGGSAGAVGTSGSNTTGGSGCDGVIVITIL